jgi:hypothetical protein
MRRRKFGAEIVILAFSQKVQCQAETGKNKPISQIFASTKKRTVPANESRPLFLLTGREARFFHKNRVSECAQHLRKNDSCNRKESQWFSAAACTAGWVFNGSHVPAAIPAA